MITCSIKTIDKNCLWDIGINNSFYDQFEKIQPNWSDSVIWGMCEGILIAFKNSVEHDLLTNVSMQRKAKGEVISDFLGQAQELLETKSIHPAAAAILIGASLEEFLRNWCEQEGLQISKSDSIDIYAKFLKDKFLLDKQDLKDILLGLELETVRPMVNGSWWKIEKEFF